ncbi:MAG: selenocysteine-specific translation elongation factor [Actinomycetales bacterium]
MRVVATAGHVDHGKSTLVRALTGIEPDRWAEERRRGMTLDLGFAWTDLPSGERLAFVDVPGHERFVPTMLAGVGPVPAVLMVVAADEGWMPQSTEHLEALAALGVRHGLLVVTRADLGDAELAAEEAREHLERADLGDLPWVGVSAVTGDGMPQLVDALEDLLRRLPPVDPEAPVRLWVDRSFSISGAGTVVTSTLGAGQVSVGDELSVASGPQSTGVAHGGSGLRTVRVRGVQSAGESLARVEPVSRVALNLRGVDPAEVARGVALVTPGQWWETAEVDVRVLPRPGVERLPAHATVHLGSAAVAAQVRPLGETHARLRLERSLPLHVGDRLLLRDPGQHRVLAGLVALDLLPQPLRRRGAAATTAAELAALPPGPDPDGEVRRRGVVRAATLVATGHGVPEAATRVGEWVLDEGHLRALAEQLPAVVAAWTTGHELEPGMPAPAAADALGLPEVALLDAVRQRAGLIQESGRVLPPGPARSLPPTVVAALEELQRDLEAAPFAAPEADRLRELGLGHREIAAAVRLGLLTLVAEGVVLGPDALDAAATRLADLPGPFTVSEARQALGTSRRVAVPLLEQLDRGRLTRRVEGDRREVVRARG